MNTAAEVRAKLVEAVKLDLVGPWPGHPFERELLPESPTRWYLTGYLVPETAPLQHRSDAEAKDQMDSAGEDGGADDGGTPDKSPPPSLLPSSMGLSVLVRAGVDQLQAEVTWGNYVWEDPTKEAEEQTDDGLGLKEEIKPEALEVPEVAVAPLQEAAPAPKGYRRTPHIELVEVPLPTSDGKPVSIPVAKSGLRIVVSARPISPDSHSRLPAGTRAVCVFLVNSHPPTERAYQGNAFQARLQIKCSAGFVPRPDLRGGDDGSRAHEWDEQVADLQYRHAFDFVSGIGCAAEPVEMQEGGACHTVQTCWIPSAEVEFVGHLEKVALPGVEMGMESLAALASIDEARVKLGKSKSTSSRSACAGSCSPRRLSRMKPSLKARHVGVSTWSGLVLNFCASRCLACRAIARLAVQKASRTSSMARSSMPAAMRANFTEAAQKRNIEMGLLTKIPYLAEQVAIYFEGLRQSGQLLRLP